MTRLAQIVAAIGGTLYDHGRRALVPGPGHSPQDRSVSLALTADGRILVHCFSPGDDWRTVRDAFRARGLIDGEMSAGVVASGPRPAVSATAHDRDRRLRAQRIWREGRHIAGTPAERYLRSRGIGRALDSDALRFHPCATSLDDRRRRPALLAALTDAAGIVQGVQITLLGASDRKAVVPTPRRVVGALLGGVVRLDSARDGALIVAEGIETALSASEALDGSAWAALTAWNLAHFSRPPDIRRLIIAADNGDAGLAAAAALAGAAASTGAHVQTHAPPPRFSDWNDYWLARANPGEDRQ